MHLHKVTFTCIKEHVYKVTVRRMDNTFNRIAFCFRSRLHFLLFLRCVSRADVVCTQDIPGCLICVAEFKFDSSVLGRIYGAIYGELFRLSTINCFL